MVIFISPNPRFDQNNQMSLEMLNEWTSGKMWSNLIIAKARTAFDVDSATARMNNGNSYTKMKDKRKIISFLMKRQKANPNASWNVTEIIDGEVQTKPLNVIDFKQLEISLINMAQHRECYNSSDHAISPECWNIPVFDDRGSYEYGYDEDYNEVVMMSEDYVFIEEAKLLVDRLKEMKNHPIQPSAQIHQVELDRDIAQFEMLLAREKEIDNKTAALAPNGTKLEEANAACEEESIKDENCPRFLEWGEWTECAGCGETAIRGRVRLGCMANNTKVDLAVCELDSQLKSQERDDCDGPPPECKNANDKYNNDNELFLKLMQQQAEQQRLSDQYNREMMNTLMMKLSENAQASAASQMDMMKFFSQQNAQFAAMNQQQQAQMTQALAAAAQNTGSGGFFGGASAEDVTGSIDGFVAIISKLKDGLASLNINLSGEH